MSVTYNLFVAMSIIESLQSKEAIPSSDKVERAKAYLNAARSLRRNRRERGVDHVDHYYKDLDGDWLEQWAQEEAEIGED